MGMKWKKKMKRYLAEALLGALLIVPAAVSSVEAPQAEISQVEFQEQEGLGEGKLPGGSLAEGELPGEDGDDGTGIMPCGDPVDERKGIENQ